LKYRISLSPEVAAQILSISSYYDGLRQDLGQKLEAEVDAILESIATNPRMYPKEFGPVHRALIQRFNLVVFYTIIENTIVILELRDARRKPPNWRSRDIRDN